VPEVFEIRMSAGMEGQSSLITVSMVLFEDEPQNFINALINLQEIEPVVSTFYFIDNSKTNRLEKYIPNSGKYKYLLVKKNIGFGAGHNIGIQDAISGESEFHLILNLDCTITLNSLLILISRLKRDSDVGGVVPCTINTTGNSQYLPKLLPSPLEQIIRSLGLLKRFPRAIDFEMKSKNYSETFNVAVLSGCCTLFRIEALKRVGLFDERFHLYFEDFDLSRRIATFYRCLHCGESVVIHGYNRGARKDIRLFFKFIHSFIKYFNKWGWFVDDNRMNLNNRCQDS